MKGTTMINYVEFRRYLNEIRQAHGLAPLPTTEEAADCHYFLDDEDFTRSWQPEQIHDEDLHSLTDTVR